MYITYARSSCDEFIFPKDCHILLRIVDTQGRPVTGARFDAGNSSPVKPPGLSDGLGRIFRTAEAAKKLEGSVRKEGYKSVSVSQLCVPADDPDMELEIALRKQ